MKILHVVEGLGKASGVTTFVENVTAELRKSGHLVDICTNTDLPLLSKGLDLWGREYDVVHIHGLWSMLLHRASVWANRDGIPVVWSTHGMTAPWSMSHKWWKKILPWYLYQKRDLGRAALVHSTAEMEAKWNETLGFRRGVVVPLGTHLPSERFVLKNRGGHRRILLFIGRVYPVKAIDRLITAFQMISHEGWTLRIVGPDQAGHVAELKKKAGADVLFVGPRFGNQLSAEYANCDALALVSHTENFGATVLDAMAYGKVVVTSTKTPWREVIDHKCGWWVENDPASLAQTLEEMISLSDCERAEMGARGRKLVEEKYTWKAVCDAMVNGYRMVKLNV